MAFATRVFCLQSPGPSISDVLAWLRQHESPVVLVGAGADTTDLLDPFWTEARLAYDSAEPPLTVRCHRGDAAFRAERDDFLTDLAELPPGPERARVEAHLAAATWVVVIEFPPEGVTQDGYRANGWLMSIFVEQAGGMVQCDGIGFYDADDEIILELA